MASRAGSARRYAEAVFELASETGTFDAWARDLRTIADFVDGARGRAPAAERQGAARPRSCGCCRRRSRAASRRWRWNLVQLLEQRGKLTSRREICAAVPGARRRSAAASRTPSSRRPCRSRTTSARRSRSRLSALTGKQVDVTPVVDESDHRRHRRPHRRPADRRQHPHAAGGAQAPPRRSSEIARRRRDGL